MHSADESAPASARQCDAGNREWPSTRGCGGTTASPGEKPGGRRLACVLGCTHLRSLKMPRVVVLWAVFIALGMGGCGDESAGEGSTSRTPAATASATAASRDEFYSTMDDLVTRLDRVVAAALAGEANAVERIKRVVRDTREQLKAAKRRATACHRPATSSSPRRPLPRLRHNGEREGLQLIRDVPIIEARDALKRGGGLMSDPTLVREQAASLARRLSGLMRTWSR